MRNFSPIYLLQDNARECLDEDFLGLQPWAEVVAGVATGTDGPFTIGIFKEWGYGKTSLRRRDEEGRTTWQI